MVRKTIKEEPTYLYDSDSCELEKSEAAIVFNLMKILFLQNVHAINFKHHKYIFTYNFVTKDKP